MNKLNLKNINASFTSQDPPKDEKFIDLFKKVIQGKLPYYYALIKKEGIKPFSSFVPKLFQEYKDYVFDKLDNKQVLAIHVYQDGNQFVMSDDYNLYFFYLELGVTELPCYVLGKPIGSFVVKSNQIDAPQSPSIDVLQDKKNH